MTFLATLSDPPYESSAFEVFHPNIFAHQKPNMEERNLAEKSETHAIVISFGIVLEQSILLEFLKLPVCLEKKTRSIIIVLYPPNYSMSFPDVTGACSTAWESLGTRFLHFACFFLAIQNHCSIH